MANILVSILVILFNTCRYVLLKNSHFLPHCVCLYMCVPCVCLCASVCSYVCRCVRAHECIWKPEVKPWVLFLGKHPCWLLKHGLSLGHWASSLDQAGSPMGLRNLPILTLSALSLQAHITMLGFLSGCWVSKVSSCLYKHCISSTICPD